MNTAAVGITGHLQELRRRLMIVLAGVAVASSLAYYWIEPVSGFFMAPLLHASPLLRKLVYTNLPEAFVTYIKVALFTGVATTFPLFIQQAWQYIAPGLHRHEKGFAASVVLFGSTLFLAGLLFGYFVALPGMLRFFMQYAGPDLQPLPRIGPYLTFVARVCIGFGLAFEIPFFMIMATRGGLLDRRHFSDKRWYSYFGMAMLAMLLAAGDVFSAGLLCLPLVALYEAGILGSGLFSRRSRPAG